MRGGFTIALERRRLPCPAFLARRILPVLRRLRVWRIASPTPSLLRSATSPPPEGEERSQLESFRALPLPRRSGERWRAKLDGVGVDQG